MGEQSPIGESGAAERVNALPAELGLTLTPEMQAARATCIDAMTARDWDGIKQSLNHYQQLAEAVVEQYRDEAYARAQIALIIDTGLMWRAADKPDSYAAELNNARRYAGNMHFDDLAVVLNAAWAEVEAARQTSELAAYKGPPVEEMVAVAKRELPAELHEELEYLLTLPPSEVMEEIASLMLGADIKEDPQAFFVRMGWTDNSITTSYPQP